jgi:putative Ca2+/H+ antiporter (TMEM165/GDT1 family)
MTGWHLFLSVFGVVFVAELPDKTAVAALVLATRGKALPVFLGASAALTVQSVVAVGAGHLVALLPATPVHVAAGLLFLVSAVAMWRRKDDADDGGGAETSGTAGFFRSTWRAFLVIFIAEWGDLTQLATAALAARYDAPLVIFAAATLALCAVSGIAVLVGHHAGKLLNPKVTQGVAAVLFAVIGGVMIVGAIRAS